MNPWVYGVVGVLVLVGVLSVTPLPGYENVKVTVGLEEVAFVVADYFSINSISAVTTGQATVLDWGALAFAPPALYASLTLTVCVSGHCNSLRGTQILPTIPLANGASLTATDSVNIGYVPAGQVDITVALYENGNEVASGTGSMCVGC